MADWSKIKAEYIRDSSTSYRKLAEKYSVSFTTLQKKALKEKWPDLRRQKEDKTETRIVDACATKEAERTCRAYEAADMAIEKIIEMMQDPELGTGGMMNLMSALKSAVSVKNTRTEADMREQEARIAKLERDAEGQMQTVEITFPDALKEFGV